MHHENADTYYQYCTAFPVGTALAQTWDTDLMTESEKQSQKKWKNFYVNLWLALGMNIHRNPLWEEIMNIIQKIHIRQDAAVERTTRWFRSKMDG